MERAVIDASKVQDAMLEALRLIRDEYVRLFDGASPGVQALDTVRRLVAYRSSRCQAVLHLVSVGYPWDAEIVLRSVYEASARILFLCMASADERGDLEREYWEVLGGIGDRRRALKVEAAKPYIAGGDPRSAAVLDAFRDPAMFAVDPVETKASRKAVEQRWSFSEVIAALGRVRDEDAPGLPELAAYLHSYGMASHLLHADSTALDLMLDRATREREVLPLLEASHACRIFSDVVGLDYLCASGVRRMLGARFADPVALHAHVWRCVELAEPIASAFYDTQSELYRLRGRTEFG